MSFQFKKFFIDDSACSMKVGTDGVLLGAWAALPKVDRAEILDVGTGSGLVALMLAQRATDAQITAIDIDKDAVCCAEKNALKSEWANSIKVLNVRLQDFVCDVCYDLIVSNPPYFKNSLKAEGYARTIARHTDTLSFEHVLLFASTHLSNNGLVSFVLPYEYETAIINFARELHFVAAQICYVKTTISKPAKRLLISFKRVKEADGVNADVLHTAADCPKTTLVLSTDGVNRSPEYAQLTQDFYL